MTALRVLDLGLREYGSVWDMQKRIVEKLASGSCPDTLILVEHFPVITVGRNGEDGDVLVPPAHLDGKGIDFFPVDRGGRATFHGPGQLVAYPLLALRGRERDIHRYLRNLEEVVIKFLAGLGVRGERRDGYTGVWINDRKVASIGIGVRKWITYHGLALNVDVDLDCFSLINPCGLGQARITSLAETVPFKIGMDEVKSKVLGNFSEVFEMRAILAPESCSLSG